MVLSQMPITSSSPSPFSSKTVSVLGSQVSSTVWLTMGVPAVLSTTCITVPLFTSTSARPSPLKSPMASTTAPKP